MESTISNQDMQMYKQVNKLTDAVAAQFFHSAKCLDKDKQKESSGNQVNANNNETNSDDLIFSAIKTFFWLL